MRETTQLMAYWINEREHMRIRKEQKEATGQWVELKYGWSNDPHMGLVRYCNVHREDDKVTRWLADNWRPQYHEPWHLVLARMVNYIPTLEVLVAVLGAGHEDALARVSCHMKGARADGMKIWTSAYTISTCGKPMDKVDYMVSVVRAVQLHQPVPAIPKLEAWYYWLKQVDGLGSFLAAQVVADMKNTWGHPLSEATDFHTWSAHGPGSLKGLSAYFGRIITPAQYPKAVKECYEEVMPYVRDHVGHIHMQDFQNCLCEFSKFMRVRVGGHVRNRYTAG